MSQGIRRTAAHWCSSKTILHQAPVRSRHLLVCVRAETGKPPPHFPTVVYHFYLSPCLATPCCCMLLVKALNEEHPDIPSVHAHHVGGRRRARGSRKETFGIGSFTFRAQRPFHPERLMEFVMNNLPSVLRSKVRHFSLIHTLLLFNQGHLPSVPSHDGVYMQGSSYKASPKFLSYMQN